MAGLNDRYGTDLLIRASVAQQELGATDAPHKKLTWSNGNTSFEIRFNGYEDGHDWAHSYLVTIRELGRVIFKDILISYRAVRGRTRGTSRAQLIRMALQSIVVMRTDGKVRSVSQCVWLEDAKTIALTEFIVEPDTVFRAPKKS